MSSFWTLSKSATLELLKTESTGLSGKEASRRLLQDGPNVLPEAKRPSIFSKIIRHFADFLILLLLAASIIALILGEIVDAIAIMVIVVLNGLIGFIQEFKAEQALASLKQSEQGSAKVYRDQRLQVVSEQALVVGDVLMIEAGDRIPADCRILKSYSLKVDEAMLTGESLPVEKHDLALPEKTVLADQRNMLFKGTAVLEGKAHALIVRIGAATEMGKIASLLQQEKKEITPLQMELQNIGERLTLLILGIAAVVFAMLLFRHSSLIEALLTAIALAVAAIPEGLPAIVAIVLSVGVLTLARKRTIVRTLKAVETLGGISYLLTDKTGTLTWNKINVVRLINSQKQEFGVKGQGYSIKGELVSTANQKLTVSQKQSLEFLIKVAVVCNSAELEFFDHENKVIGDTTEGALLVASERFGQSYQELRSHYDVLFEEPFSSDSKRMVMVVRAKESRQFYLFAKGAPEVILAMCTGQDTRYFEDKTDEWAKNGWRNLAFAAYKLKQGEETNYHKYLNRLQFLGMVAQADTVREEAIEAVRKAAAAGIETIMITGDHRLAAFSIARQTGIATNARQVLNGDELPGMEDNLLLDRLTATKYPLRVFARVTPEQKLRLVELIKKRTGQIVAVTGDGVNDAPSIKAANVGVAMGKSGSDVAKEVADIVLADDNYATLVTGIFRGRVIFDNLIKFIRYLLSCNIGEVIVVFVGTLLGHLHILLPIQILFINLVTDSLPALALGFEKGTPAVLLRRPRNPRERILNWKRWKGILIEGVFIGALVLFVFYYFLPFGFAYARTLAFLALVIIQLLQALNNRDEKQTIFQIGLFNNRFLWFSMLISLVFTYLVTQIGFLASVFQTQAVTNPTHWLILFAVSSLILVLSGIRKTLSLW